MYSMYAYASNNTPSYTQFNSYVVWRIHPHPQFVTDEACWPLLGLQVTTWNRLTVPFDSRAQ